MPRPFTFSLLDGFSLLELLMVMVLLSILIAMAAPDLQSALTRSEGEVALRNLSSQLSSARSAAIEHGVTVTLCPSSDGSACSGTWSSGSIVFTDRNGDRNINTEDQLIRVSLTELNGHIQWRAFQNRQYLQIDAIGWMRYQSGNFTYCPANGDPYQARQLVVNSTGRTRLAQDTDGDGLREDANGQPLHCD